MHGSRVLRFCNASLSRRRTKSKPQDDSQGNATEQLFLKKIGCFLDWVFSVLFFTRKKERRLTMLGERRSDDVKSENQKTIVIPIGVRAGVSNPFQAVGREGNV